MCWGLIKIVSNAPYAAVTLYHSNRFKRYCLVKVKNKVDCLEVRATDLLELSARTQRKKLINSALFEDVAFSPHQVWAVFAFYAKSSLTSLISLDFLVLFYQEKRTRENK